MVSNVLFLSVFNGYNEKCKTSNTKMENNTKNVLKSKYESCVIFIERIF